MFCVLNIKRIGIYLSIIFLFLSVLFASNYLSHYAIEVSTANQRLLPIYSVETPDKAVALTFDCAWSWSQ